MDRRATERKDTTKDRIIAAMYHLVAEVGYEKASIGRICAVVGIAKPSVYYYFKDKEAIFEAMLDTLYPAIGYTDGFDEVRTAAAYRQKLLDMGIKIIDHYCDDQERRLVFAEMEVQSARIKAVGEHRARINQDIIASLTSVLRCGVEVGAFAPDFDVKLRAQGLFELLAGFSQSIVNQDRIDERLIWRDVVSLFFVS
jgi:AcrR family transcriptional regulator